MLAISSGVRAQGRDEARRRPSARPRSDRSLRVERRGPSPAAASASTRCAALGLDLVDLVAALGARVEPEVARRPWPAATATVPWGSRVTASTRSTSASPSGGAAEHVEPAADLGVLERAQVAVDVQDHVVELVVVPAPSSPRPRSRWISASTSSVPHLAAQRGQLAGSMAWAAGVGVEQRLEAGQVVGGSARVIGGTRWSIDDRVGAPLGLRALAGVVDHERVEERQVAEGGVGVAARPTGRWPCRAATRACRACRRGRRRRRPTPVVEPAVEGQVVVGRGQVGGVVGADRVGAEPPRRLDGHEHAAEVEPGEHESRRRRDVDARRAASPHIGRRPRPGASAGRRREPRSVVVGGRGGRRPSAPGAAVSVGLS